MREKREGAMLKNSTKNHYPIPFGTYKCTIYQRCDAETGSWFFRVWLKEEDRYFRKSLRTIDKQEAIKRAQTELIHILAKIETGQKVLALGLNDVLRRFSLHIEDQVKQGALSPRTWVSQRYRIMLGMEFLKTIYPDGLNTKISSIDGEVFRGYLKWRLDHVASKNRTIRRDVVRDELLVVRKMFLYAQREKFCSSRAVPNWDFPVEREAPRRERIAIQHLRRFIATLHKWFQDGRDGKDAYHRRALLNIVGIVRLTGMRSGEIFGLMNRDVGRRGEDECLITIRAETSKVRRGRQIIVPELMGRWIDSHQRHKEPGAFVFSPHDAGNVSVRDVFYHQYKSLRTQLKKVNLEWFDLYHLRHWWITQRLLAEEPIHLVADAAGTSVREIEQTYSHVLTELTTKRFAEKEVRWKIDGSYDIVKAIKSL